ncbi:MAG: polyphosphate polymerase domain-containing protein [Bacteroidales bacterium]
MFLEKVIYKFKGISLSEMDAVKLMNRSDRKYWFNVASLAELLADVIDDYYLLEVDGERNLPYATTYYDTQEEIMYNNHHRGKLNRYKIRRRNYQATKSSFLEVKFKNNKGRTVKVRKSSDYAQSDFSLSDSEFITNNTPYKTIELKQVLDNRFNRLMLVSKEMNERCTIDTELRFISNGQQVGLDSLVVLEVKTNGRSKSHIIDALNQHRIKPSGFSKYCVGRSITDDTLKINNFKRKHRDINKITKIVV